MYAKKFVPFMVAVAVLFVAGAAFAGSIDFDFTGNDSRSTWTWGGGSKSLSASSDNVTLGLDGGSSAPLTGNVLLSFTSGPGTGGSGTLGSPYTFGPSNPASLTVTGCLPGSGSGCSTVTLFAGQFLQGEVAYTSSGNLDFDGFDLSGIVNSGVESYFGWTSANVTGSLDAILVCSAGFFDGCMGGLNGLVASGDLVVSPGPSGPPTPEPSALILLGSGLCGLTFYMRRRARA
jgi:hypothetical protein